MLKYITFQRTLPFKISVFSSSFTNTLLDISYRDFTITSGVVLATAYIHIMPDAGEDIKEGLNDLDYPLSSLLAFAATIVVMIIEQLANDAFSSLVGYQQVSTLFL